MGERTVQQCVEIQVRPRSSRTGVTAREDGTLVVHVHAPAVKGAANAECVAVLAKALSVPRSAIRIVRGGRSRVKHIAVAGLAAAEARARLARAAGEPGE